MATIKDVAEEAGVAVETVSRVLNNRGYISEKTRKKVYDAMDAINYTPNVFAQGLSKGNMDCILVIVPMIGHPYFNKSIACIEAEAKKRGYKVFLYNSEGDTDKESRAISLCQGSFMSGVILYSSSFPINELIKLKLPVVLVEREAKDDIVSIRCDNVKGGVLAARHLMDLGCKNMMIIGTKTAKSMPGDLRSRYFIEECEKAGLTVSKYCVDTKEDQMMEYNDVIRQALKENPECDGIFATSDVIASEVIQECDSMGLRIPEDIQLIGFDDVQLAMLTSPRLTTIRQPVDKMAAAAVKAIEKMNNGEKVENNIMLPVSLIQRESTSGSDYISHAG